MLDLNPALATDNGVVYNYVKFQITLWCAVTLFAWEWITLLPDEIMLWRGKKSYAVWALLVARYVTAGGLVTIAVFLYGRPPSCQTALYMVYVLYAFSTICIALVFVGRTIAICSPGKKTRIFIYSAYGVVCAAWIASISGFRSADLPISFMGAKCTTATLGDWRVTGWISTMLFDFTILGLTLTKLRTLRTDKRASGTTATSNNSIIAFIKESSLLYFIGVTSANLSMTIVDLVTSGDYNPIMSVPIAFVFQEVVCARLVFAMRKYGRLSVLPSHITGSRSDASAFGSRRRRNESDYATGFMQYSSVVSRSDSTGGQLSNIANKIDREWNRTSVSSPPPAASSPQGTLPSNYRLSSGPDLPISMPMAALMSVKVNKNPDPVPTVAIGHGTNAQNGSLESSQEEEKEELVHRAYFTGA